MAARRHLVVLFEDEPERQRLFKRELSAAVGRSFRVVAFSPPAIRTGAFEDRLFEDLTNLGFYNAALFVSDRDLSRIESYVGLSEAAVSRTAERFGIPIALYAQGPSFSILSKNNFPGDGKIVLRGASRREHVQEAAVLSKGFVTVAKRTDRALKRKADHTSPAAIASFVMGRPAYADRVTQYAIGDQKGFSQVARVTDDADSALRRRNRTRLIGTWIYDSLLRFPGLALSEVAAASYLNIGPRAFRDPTVRALFATALYKGPFATSAAPLWWRPDIDDLLLKESTVTGRDLVKKKLGRSVPRCSCSANPKLRAGYLCMITNKPISLEESEGGLSWFPPGADLARISKRKLDEIRPWLALY